MKIGYARVSTKDQSLDAQIDALKKAGCEEIYAEKASGSKDDRTELKACLRALREGDTLVVWKLDRFGRTLRTLIEQVTELGERGIAFESLTEKLDTSSAGGKLMFHVFASLAEFERSLTIERVQNGLASAKARGKRIGRPQKLTTAQKKQIADLLENGHTGAEVARSFNVSRGTVLSARQEVQQQAH